MSRLFFLQDCKIAYKAVQTSEQHGGIFGCVFASDTLVDGLDVLRLVVLVYNFTMVVLAKHDVGNQSLHGVSLASKISVDSFFLDSHSNLAFVVLPSEFLVSCNQLLDARDVLVAFWQTALWVLHAAGMAKKLVHIELFPPEFCAITSYVPPHKD